MAIHGMDNPLFIFSGWVIDGTGGPVRHDVLLRVEHGLITSMKRARPDDIKSLGPAIVNLAHCTLLPGLVDCHVHLAMSGTGDAQIRRQQLNYAFDQARFVVAEHIRQQLSCGVVAVRDGGDLGSHVLRYKEECLAFDGLPLQLKAAGKAWRARGRYGRFIGRPPAEGVKLADCIAMQERIPDHIKLINSGLNSLKEFGKETPPQFSSEDLDSALQAARKLGLKTMIHANGSLPVRQAVDAGCYSVEHGFFMGRENLERMADLQVFWVPTAFTMKAYAKELAPESEESNIALRTLDHQLDQISYGRHLGVPIVVGTDCGSLGVNHGAAFVEEIGLLIQAGFSIEEVISCATLDGARLLGLRNELGQLKKGMPASFVACIGDPSQLLESMRFPEAVYVNGELVAQTGSSQSS